MTMCMFQVTAQNCQEKFEVILSELCKENKKSVSSSALPMQTNKILRPRLDKKQFCFCPLLICVWIACFQPDTDIQKLLTSGNRTEMITIRFAGWISGWIVSLQPDTDIQKLLSNGNRIRIRISERQFSIL